MTGKHCVLNLFSEGISLFNTLNARWNPEKQNKKLLRKFQLPEMHLHPSPWPSLPSPHLHFTLAIENLTEDSWATIFVIFLGSNINGQEVCIVYIYFSFSYMGLPWWLRRWRICLQCRRPSFDSWVGKMPWRRKGQLIAVFLPGKSHGQRCLEGYSPWDHKELDTTEQLTHI